MPLLGIFERPRPLPGSIVDSVLGPGASRLPVGAAAAPQAKG
jgi:ubiquinol-cytochrome c reductase cytochrome b/c1 subunit